MRERTTWQSNGRETARQAATFRRAEDESSMDIYNMHGKRVQPKVDSYDLGSDFAEGVVTDMNVADEYEGKKVKRNEIGMGEFRADTFNDRDFSKPKYENSRQASERKAIASHRLASTLLRSEDRDLVRKVAVGFMGLSESSLSTALKAVEATKPEALDDKARFKRAYACTKLAATMLGDSADEPTVERLARQIYRIDDPTLKTIVKTVASARVAVGDDSSPAKTPASSPGASSGAANSSGAAKSSAASSPAAPKKVGGEKKSPASPTASSPASPTASSPASPTASSPATKGPEKAASGGKPWDKKPTEGAKGTSAGAKGDAPGLEHLMEKTHAKKHDEPRSAEAMIAEMLGDSSPAAAHGQGEHGQGEHGQGEHAHGMMPSSPATQGGMPGMPSSPATQGGMPPTVNPMSVQTASLGISFDDDETPMTVHTSALEALFADDPEVKAQREISAANREAAVRSGYNFERTASSKGAKKLGNVQSSKETKQDVSLEMLWDRP